MIIGTGIDIVELLRIREVMDRHQSFVKRIMTNKEKEIFDKLSNHRRVEFLAGRFAAKEAFAKAVGTGIGKHLSWQDIEVLSDENGKPIILSKQNYGKIHLSISHSKQYAIANVIIEERD
jgi:holo-[acyl-carrier protein] synthase